eukprot:1099861-Amorphochlora_amoeboformis.AAC.4
MSAGGARVHTCPSFHGTNPYIHLQLDLGMPLSPGFNAIAKCKLPKAALRTTVLTSKRWTPQEAFATGILDQLASGINNIMCA